MFQFINEYSEQVRRHLEQAQDQLNEQWKQTKHQYFQILEDLLLKPINRLLKGLFTKYFKWRVLFVEHFSTETNPSR